MKANARGHRLARAGLTCCIALATVALSAVAAGPAFGQAGHSPRLITHQSYVEEVMGNPDLPIQDLKAMFAFVLGSLPDRVKVYPTENYYYFSFITNRIRYAGNIRLDPGDRDQGKVHFAYFEDMAEWREEPPITYRLLGKADGVTVEKLEPLLYRVAYQDKSVLFELNDLSKVVPPPGTMTADETYIGPVFDDLAIRFFLIYNSRLKVFHYVLDETEKVNDGFIPARQTDRILIGKRTGFAFYQDDKQNRKILIGVFEGNVLVNNYFDGPFDQLPLNFIEGDALRKAIVEVEPSLKRKVNRLGDLADGSGRFLIAPYAYYRSEEELLAFHSCTINNRIPAKDRNACFAMDWSTDLAAPRQIVALRRIEAKAPPKRGSRTSHAAGRHRR